MTAHRSSVIGKVKRMTWLSIDVWGRVLLLSFTRRRRVLGKERMRIQLSIS